MVGDAISHAVLPGIVIAYLFTGSGASIPMLIGASAFGILATIMIETMHKKGKLQEDASIGLTFTWLFAIGVILISLFTRNVHLDTDCVLFGEIAYVPLDVFTTKSGISLGPRNVWIMGTVLILILLIILIGYKGLFLTTFDAGYAASLGISTVFWHYLLMGAVSLTTVVSFESVGAILVVAFLITPAATAYLLTNDLRIMLLLASSLGISASFFGYYLAVVIDGSIAGAMTTVLGIQFLLVFLFSPSQGILFKKKRTLLPQSEL